MSIRNERGLNLGLRLLSPSRPEGGGRLACGTAGLKAIRRRLRGQNAGRRFPLVEFHVLAQLRKKYQVEESLFTGSGNVILPNYRAARALAHRMNLDRDLANHPERAVKAGRLNAMGLIDEICHYAVRLYEETANPGVFKRALGRLNRAVGADRVKGMLRLFGMLFPPLEVYSGKNSLEKYVRESTGGKPHREVVLEEMILLDFANNNPAFAPFKELFDDQSLREGSAYRPAIDELEKFFRSEGPFGPEKQSLFDLLRAPVLASPESLAGQLLYIKEHWGLVLSGRYTDRILGAGDLIREDAKLVFHGEAATPPVPTYKPHETADVGLLNLERFSRDLEWMPNVVLLAKNTHVWLHQLSKQYGRPVTRLDEIPDEELDRLARRNFTALWLIGVWERSPASRKIKQWTGNPEAVASAYSVYDYVIAEGLGGEEAFQDLRSRAWRRGIRLAGDMVPNHMGIYSKWVIEHPEYFIQSPYPPFPGYRFTGGNLSEHPDIEIRIEDGYWNRSDAAVVFERIDKRTGNVRYIYHGNDGTRMPWNDSAQLDFLRAETREAVMQTIFQVAKRFPIIRFDAAMTLTLRHFQRLWYPPPGRGGDIPSRADHSLSSEEFNRLFPHEFWREVVDRINRDLPDTLLLAEAFWLLEGYFVRTLGMHRVYNSAFMHMLAKEENAKYRELIRNTMRYNPEILKRYVNFMSNPDEQTAAAQFGRDDKYFGVALLLATLPGLPMWAHGQVEGSTEKYGMEYQRAYYDEVPDRQLIQRHEREIFPLLGKRWLFSQVSNFEMYDFVEASGRVNENVFAYSNFMGGERALVCYHNKYAETAGWIKTSVGRNAASSGEPEIITKTLAEALAFLPGEDVCYVFKDLKTNLEFIRSGAELMERGLFVELKAYQYHVFLDFREVLDPTGDYRRLSRHLRGRGVPDMDEALRELRLSPFREKLALLFSPEVVEDLAAQIEREDRVISGEKLDRMAGKFREVAEQAASMLESVTETTKITEDFRRGLESIPGEGIPSRDVQESLVEPIDPVLRAESYRQALILLGWMVFQRLGYPKQLEAFDSLRGEKALLDIFQRFGISEHRSRDDMRLLRILLAYPDVFMEEKGEVAARLRDLLDSDEVREFIKVNSHRGVWYYNKEQFEELVHWLFKVSAVRRAAIEGRDKGMAFRKLVELAVQKMMKLSDEVGYRLEDLKARLSSRSLG